MRWAPIAVCQSEIGGSTVLFSEEHQRLVALNATAAELWQRLEAGFDLLDESAPAAVREASEKALALWAEAGLIRDGRRARERKGTRPVQPAPNGRLFEIGLVSVRLELCDGLPVEDIWSQFAQFRDTSRKPQVTLSFRPAERSQKARAGQPDGSPAQVFDFLLGGRLVSRCAPEETLPLLKAALTEVILEHSPYVLALHAAAVVIRDRLLIVTGPSGRGKSTLCAALVASGFGFAADDLVLLDGDGVARGIPMAPGLKETAWNLLRDVRPDLDSRPIYRRPDGRAVRFLTPGSGTTGCAAACRLGGDAVRAGQKARRPVSCRTAGNPGSPDLWRLRPGRTADHRRLHRALPAAPRRAQLPDGPDAPVRSCRGHPGGLQMSRLSPTLALTACLRGQVPDDIDWTAVISLANRCWLTPQVLDALRGSGAARTLPADVRDYLEFIHDRALERNHRLRDQLRQAVAACNACGIAPTLLKGAIDLIDDPDGRPSARLCADVDLLVRADDLAAVRTALLALGYSQPEADVPSMFARPSDPGPIELHCWTPTGQWYSSLGGINSAPVRLAFGTLRLRVPPAHLRIMHLILHDQIKEGDDWRGCVDLRHLHDIARMVSEGVDWDALRRVPGKRRERDALEETLMLARRLFGVQVPGAGKPTLLQTLRYHRRLAPLTHPRLAVPLRIAGDAAWACRRMIGGRMGWPGFTEIPGALAGVVRDRQRAYRFLLGPRIGPKT